MAVEGSITIGIGANTDEFDKKIADLERKMSKEENKKIEYEAEINLREGQIQKAKEILQEMPVEIDRINLEMQELAAQMDLLKVDSPEFETAKQKLIGLQIESKVYQELWKRLPSEIAKQEMQLENLKSKQEQINQKAYDYEQAVANINLQKQVADADKLKASFNNVGKSIQNSIKSVARLALGVLGVRSAFLALRRASSDLAGYDKQYAANIEYIRYALTQAIAPVLQWIVRLAATLLGYINAIVQGWFGINLFSRGSAENFNKMKASTGGISKAVKEIKKQLAGFDEINMLTDQSDTGTKAGAGGIATPSFDLSGLQAEKPAWLQWIIDNKELVIGALAGITAGVTALKLGASGLLALGIGVAVAGVVALIQDIIKFIKDPSWEKFVNIVRDLGIVLTGVGIAMVAVNSANPVGWILILIGVIVTVTATVIKNWDKIKVVLGKVGKWINDNVIKPIKNFFSNLWEKLKSGASNAWKGIKKVFSKVGSFFEGVYNTIKKILGKEIEVNIHASGGGGKGSSGGGGGGGGFRAHGGIYYPSKLPKLASGGIINVPGRGVPYNGAIIGERGAEAVVPLTDRQQMELLGATIGKYININATIPVSVGNRQIAREIRKIQAEENFAFNQ